MADKTTDTPELPPDLADLEAVALQADAALEGGAAALPGAAPAEPEPSNRPAELAAMLTMGVMMVSPALPFVPQCYTPEVCEQIGTALDAVATKHGWNLDNIMSPELALAAVALPPTIQCVVLGRQHFALRRAELEAQQRRAQQGRAVDMAPGTGAGQNPNAGTMVQPATVHTSTPY